MRKRQYTYADLAAEWGISESSVKRIMSREDLSLERLYSLAKWLGYSLQDLLALADEDDGSRHCFTDEQDHFLANHPQAAYVYLRTTFGESIADVAKHAGISLPLTHQYLHQLERVGLIEVMPGDRVRVLFRGPYQWRDNGAMMTNYLRPFIDAVYKHFVTNSSFARYPDDQTVDNLVRPFEMYLTKESLNQLVKEMRSLVTKYRNRTNTETAFSRFEDLTPVSGLILLGRFNGWERVWNRQLNVERLEHLV